MADYTDDEINTAVTSLVSSTVAAPTGTLGTRQTDVTFTGIQQAAASIFILYPLAPFYCAYLGAQRLLEAIEAEELVLTSLLEAVGSLGRLVLPVTDLSPLYNAQAALQALSTAVSAATPVDITKLPQFQRYASNVSTFLTGPASAVKSGGAIVPTPQEAVASIPSYVSQLASAHAAVIQSAMYLQNAMTDFTSVNLPSLVAQGVINNAQTVLANDTATLAGLSATQRLGALRTPVLNLLTAQSTVAAFGSFAGPTNLYSITGTGYPYSDATHLATPAVLEATVGPPYNVVPGTNDSLSFLMDGSATPVVVALPSSLFATMQGTVVEGPANAAEGGSTDGYLIGNGTEPTGLAFGATPPNNDSLHIFVNSLTGEILNTSVGLTLSNNGPPITRRTAQNICDDINAAFAAVSITQLLAEPYFYPAPNFQGAMNITPGVGASATFDLPLPVTGSLQACASGNLLVISTGPNAGLWSVTAVNSTTELVATYLSGTPTAQTSVQCTVGPVDRAVRFRFTDPITVTQQWSITVLGDTTVAQSTALTLGFTPGATVTCAPVQPTDIITAINTQQTSLTVSSIISNPTPFTMNTDVTNPLHVIASKILSSGALVYAAGPPNTITLSGFSGLLAAGVVLGDVLVLRGQGNTWWNISAFTDTTLTAFSNTYTATSAASATFEIGPNIQFVAWQTIQVQSGANQGNYLISGTGVSPIDILLQQRTPIAYYTNPSTMQLVSQPAVVGIEMLTFASENETTLSSVSVSGTGVSLFWSPAPTTATGSTGYFFLPSPSAGAVPNPGDMLELFASSYTTPSLSNLVTGVDTAAGGFILAVSPDVPDLPTTWSFGQIPPPFAALMHGEVINYSAFSSAIATWLAAPPQQPTFFQSLNRLINPLIANANPTPAEIGAATAAITSLAVLLDINDATANSQPTASTLEAILDSYTVSDVSQIDTMIKTYLAQGADAAIDILTGGQFSSFFGLTQDGTSYAGTMQAAMRSVAQNDLPVRKINRSTSVQSQLTGTSQSPDYEFDTSDTETPMKPDAPVDFAPTTGSSS